MTGRLAHFRGTVNLLICEIRNKEHACVLRHIMEYHLYKK